MRKLICTFLLALLASTSIQSSLSPAFADARISPTLLTAEVNPAGSEILLTYDMALSESAVPSLSQFAVTTAGAPRSISQVAVASTVVTLTLSRRVLIGQAVTLDYVAPDPVDDTTTNSAIQDVTGIDAPALVLQTVTNTSTVKEKEVNAFGGKFAAIGSLAGFASQYSVMPGDVLSLKIRSSKNYSLKIIRISSRGSNNGVQIPLLNWASTFFRHAQKSCTVTKSTGTVDCNWATTASVPTIDLETGLYVVRVESQSGFHIIPFVVRSQPSEKTTAFVMSWMSLMAYNRFGGFSAYEINSTHKSASVISANRPLDLFGFSIFKKFEVPAAIAVDRNISDATYTTDIDIDLGNSNPADYTSVVTGGHSEYWSANLRSKIESRVDAGMNLFIAGANSIYRRVKVDNTAKSHGRHLIILKSTLHKKIESSTDRNYRFRDWPKAWPETKLTAVGYQYYYHRCGATPNNWKIADATWWGYSNTGVKNKQTIPGLVGTEVDQILPGYQIPASTQLVAHATYTCATSGIKRSANHDAAYITTKNGGAIFATGTQKWACAMNGKCHDRGFTVVSNRFALTVTNNVITAFNQGPAGKQAGHTAKFNVGKFYRSSAYKKISR